MMDSDLEELIKPPVNNGRQSIIVLIAGPGTM